MFANRHGYPVHVVVVAQCVSPTAATTIDHCQVTIVVLLLATATTTKSKSNLIGWNQSQNLNLQL